MSNSLTLSRRKFLISSSALVVSAGSYKNSFALWRFFAGVAARFAAGLLFDSVAAYLLGGGKSYRGGYGGRRRYSAPQFDYDMYKTSIVVHGIADYDAFKEDRVRIMISKLDEASHKRLGLMIKYMAENNVGLRRYFDELSYPVTEATSADDLLSVEYFTFDGDESLDRTHEMFLKLKEITNVSALDEFL